MSLKHNFQCTFRSNVGGSGGIVEDKATSTCSLSLSIRQCKTMYPDPVSYATLVCFTLLRSYRWKRCRIESIVCFFLYIVSLMFPVRSHMRISRWIIVLGIVCLCFYPANRDLSVELDLRLGFRVRGLQCNRIVRIEHETVYFFGGKSKSFSRVEWCCFCFFGTHKQYSYKIENHSTIPMNLLEYFYMYTTRRRYCPINYEQIDIISPPH